jgi:hypothetical protein
LDARRARKFSSRRNPFADKDIRHQLFFGPASGSSKSGRCQRYCLALVIFRVQNRSGSRL